nr:MAG TPA: hypothetical protein [Caudoviricetes sp.]
MRRALRRVGRAVRNFFGGRRAASASRGRTSGS